MKKINRLTGSHIALFMVLDIASITLSYFAALWVRFEFHIRRIPARFFKELGFYLPVLLLTGLVTGLLNGILGDVLLKRIPDPDRFY